MTEHGAWWPTVTWEWCRRARSGRRRSDAIKKAAPAQNLGPGNCRTGHRASALRKLDPRHLWHNPVMFIVEIGAVLTTAILIGNLTSGGVDPTWFVAWITAWLWFTVLFANFAEAMAEGRGKAQAETLAPHAHGNDGQGAHQRR